MWKTLSFLVFLISVWKIGVAKLSCVFCLKNLVFFLGFLRFFYENHWKGGSQDCLLPIFSFRQPHFSHTVYLFSSPQCLFFQIQIRISFKNEYFLGAMRSRTTIDADMRTWSSTVLRDKDLSSVDFIN